jgi:hypothetical protein
MESRAVTKRHIAAALAVATMSIAGAGSVDAADHLDTPSVIADPRADIGDLFAWTSPNGRQLNLAMTIVGHTFSDKLAYTFHVDSGARYGATTSSTSIVCRFQSANAVDCRLDEGDRAVGDASKSVGLESRKHQFRVFAGLRDDPFFNNVRGTRDAYNVAAAAIQKGAPADPAGCPRFDAATSQTIANRWRQTEGGKAKNFLAGWTPASIVVAVDLGAVRKGGHFLAVWGTTSAASGQIDRMGRPLTANALLATLGPAELSDDLKERYNKATPASSAPFVTEIEKGLAFYDGLDGECGNQLFIELGAEPALRYRMLANTLADDRLWVNSDKTACTRFFAVEIASYTAQGELGDDCGGRTPTEDAIDVYRSLLVNGANTGIDDGVDRDDHEQSSAVFPFLAAPDTAPAVKP